MITHGNIQGYEITQLHKEVIAVKKPHIVIREKWNGITIVRELSGGKVPPELEQKVLQI